MTDPQFFNASRRLTVREIAELTGAVPAAGAPLDRSIGDIASLDRAGPDQLAFLDSPRYASALASTGAAVCLVSKRFAADVPAHVTPLVAARPYVAFVTVARVMFAEALRPRAVFPGAGRQPGAHIHALALLEDSVVVEPGAVIGPGAEVGTGTYIGPGAVIGPKVRIGRECSVGPGASVTNALIGDRVTLHAGCRIGQDGFGYLPSPQGHVKAPQLGRVIIQDAVEVGANSTIDRGSGSDTVIGEGTKIDNLVQIGHNVEIGRHCIIVAQTGISGSCTIGDFVMMGGQVGIADHIKVGTGARLAARSGVLADVPAGTTWSGYPARPGRQFLRDMVFLHQLATRNGRES
jgi:UDP-3-O-[3-hydroxymyristoyl] glucosamine N-acyltransferase